ncbi:hypothetical protein F511_45853 [Dorcoceras hygrometricum]|uniref:Uncharacterized protein n=1 Tax=Dorcoceras hygrometricum TaxID=472368 RepID=A0A2Z6ZV12_9LAMI|nr:hypothetical protein F511_45853 [Dorcoceras hygrometricum]
MQNRSLNLALSPNRLNTSKTRSRTTLNDSIPIKQISALNTLLALASPKRRRMEKHISLQRTTLALKQTSTLSRLLTRVTFSRDALPDQISHAKPDLSYERDHVTNMRSDYVTRSLITTKCVDPR